jgi:hypothetical protein
MNPSDSRTARHWRRDQLVLRMMRHEARTSTISAWTGLSPNRVRTRVQEHAGTPAQRAPKRHRGQPPRQVGYFFRTLRVATHAATLASLFELLDLLPATAVGVPARNFRSVARGEVLCYAYEVYCTMVETPTIRFEHAVLLATALADGQEISLQDCPRCDARMLVDHFGDARDGCTHCRPTAQLPAIPGRPDAPPPDPRFHRPHIQLKLFAPLDDGLRPGTQQTSAPTPAALRPAVPPETTQPDVTPPTVVRPPADDESDPP